MKHNGLLRNLFAVFGLVFVLTLVLPLQALAENQQGNFSLQVTPSPLVVSIKPGDTSTTELKIRNNGDKAEYLKIEPKSFTVNSDTGSITLGNSAPTDVSKWVSFSNPTFTVQAGEWFTERVTITLPENTGFSYSFALEISRVENAKPQQGETAVRGSVAVFTLVSVDRPGAKKELQVVSFKATQAMYEYLPVTLKTTFKSTGNTIVQPAGNIFIQRGKNDKKPIAVLPVNDGGGYILPGSTRVLTSKWNDGFPSYVESQDAANSTTKTNLVWNWQNINNFRIGPYKAKLVGIYNDGTKDVPLEAETTFWILPWKILIGLLLVVILIVVGIATIVRKSFKVVHHPKKKEHEKPDSE